MTVSYIVKDVRREVEIPDAEDLPTALKAMYREIVAVSGDAPLRKHLESELVIVTLNALIEGADMELGDVTKKS
jgi:hypothetical protein